MSKKSSARGTPSAFAQHVDPSVGSPLVNQSLTKILGDISSESFVRVAVNDLVAYEYVDAKTKSWKWALGTVAGLPEPRLVQLMMWEGGNNDTSSSMPPPDSPISLKDREKALQRLKAVEKEKQEAKQEMQDLNATLTTSRARYEAGRDGYKQELQSAEETLQQARVLVKNTPAKDWREIRSYTKPPAIVELIMDAVMIALGEKVDDWHDTLRVIRHPQFVQRVADFDPAKVSPGNRRRLQKIIDNPRFTYEDAMNGSRALGALQRWVSAQVDTSRITSALTDFDAQKKKDKTNVQDLENRVSKFEAALAKMNEEEERLHAMIGDDPLQVDLGAASPSPMGSPSVSLRTRPDSALSRESVYGTQSTWTLTDQTCVILRSSVLVNYDQPKSTTITLTPEQVSKLKKALEARAAPLADEAQAAAKRKALQDEVDELRGDLADALKKLNDLKVSQNERDNDLAEKDRAIEDLKRQLGEGGKGKDSSGHDDDEGAERSSPSARDGTPELSDAMQRIADQEAEIAALQDKLQDLEAQSKDADPNIKGSAQGGGGVVSGERDLNGIIAALEREIKRLRVEAGNANDTMSHIQTVINANPKLKACMAVKD